MNLWEYSGQNVKITFIDGKVLTGRVSYFTSALDNEPQPASLTIETDKTDALVECLEPEIKKVELI